MIRRGSVWWAELGELECSRPGKRRPVLVIQSNPSNASRLNTTLVAVITCNTRVAAMPGNVFLPATTAGLTSDSVVKVTALVTLDKAHLHAETGRLPASLMHEVDRGLRGILPLTESFVNCGGRRQRASDAAC